MRAALSPLAKRFNLINIFELLRECDHMPYTMMSGCPVLILIHPEKA